MIYKGKPIEEYGFWEIKNQFQYLERKTVKNIIDKIKEMFGEVTIEKNDEYWIEFEYQGLKMGVRKKSPFGFYVRMETASWFTGNIYDTAKLKHDTLAKMILRGQRLKAQKETYDKQPFYIDYETKKVVSTKRIEMYKRLKRVIKRREQELIESQAKIEAFKKMKSNLIKGEEMKWDNTLGLF